MKYVSHSSTGATPYIEVQNVVLDFSNSLSHSQARLMTSLQSIHIPVFPTSSPSTPSIPTSPPLPNEARPELPPTSPTGQEWTAAPTPVPTSIVSSSGIFPTTIIPTNPIPPTYTPSKIPPTNTPKPTSAPLPTAIPELPPVTSNQRPGSNLEEVFKEVSKRMCVPVALLKATQQEESGQRYRTFATDKFSLANRLNWWNESSTSEYDYFTGVAYSAQSGKAPSDSKFPGKEIAHPIQPNAYDQWIMGPEQISQQEQDASRKNTIKILPNNIDRRVLFDNFIIYSSITLNRVGSSPRTSCDDWPEETVRLVAEKHYGACAYSGGNYCDDIWRLYKSFK